MIINHLDHLKLYAATYPRLLEVDKMLQTQDILSLIEGKNPYSDDIYTVFINGVKNPNFEGILEVHREWIDIHIPLDAQDIIATKPLALCQNEHKAYDLDNDYMLYREEDSCLSVIPIKSFALIDTDMCHMAMLGEGNIKKLVIKFKK
ncbi:MAG: YhcH/YjgK/YiaL family protein [Chitinophagales bacterium]|jgi:YhcH/YjgK/YiaL family protein|nr:YhcH/YjgK/YiaL family protein [Chitinophagales bacterium]